LQEFKKGLHEPPEVESVRQRYGPP